ncbi:Uncharacterised protein [Serratia proteamaculans]|jgi:hypothetical protein|nr:Uncharacterised protein [Serratia proteamaculans]CAI1030611.1 Uncharacterised protein [Serratia proteamaculans]CAI1727500.1 Uncharacterised protein [Serratia proteamaculans]
MNGKLWLTRGIKATFLPLIWRNSCSTLLGDPSVTLVEWE